MNCCTHARDSPLVLSAETYSARSGFPSCKIHRLMSGNEPATARDGEIYMHTNNSIITTLMQYTYYWDSHVNTLTGLSYSY